MSAPRKVITSQPATAKVTTLTTMTARSPATVPMLRATADAAPPIPTPTLRRARTKPNQRARSTPRATITVSGLLPIQKAVAPSCTTNCHSTICQAACENRKPMNPATEIQLPAATTMRGPYLSNRRPMKSGKGRTSSWPTVSAAPTAASDSDVVFTKKTTVNAITSPFPRLSIRLAVTNRPFPTRSGRPQAV